MKTITFAVPCYNSAAYMDHCVETLLATTMSHGTGASTCVRMYSMSGNMAAASSQSSESTTLK